MREERRRRNDEFQHCAHPRVYVLTSETLALFVYVQFNDLCIHVSQVLGMHAFTLFGEVSSNGLSPLMVGRGRLLGMGPFDPESQKYVIAYSHIENFKCL